MCTAARVQQRAAGELPWRAPQKQRLVAVCPHAHPQHVCNSVLGCRGGHTHILPVPNAVGAAIQHADTHGTQRRSGL